MKNLRKLFTLALALMMLVSVFTLPAMAATVEHDHECEATSEIQPRYAIGPCFYCGGRTVYCGMKWIDEVLYTITECTVCGQTCKFAN